MNREEAKTKSKRRRLIQWALAPLVIITIGLGYWFPILGFTVPIVMVMGMVGGVFRGRIVCGGLCPRGAFLDRMVGAISQGKSIPESFRSPTLRWGLFAALMGFMAYRISQQPGDIPLWQHLGHIFWLMCLITTLVALVLGIFINPRSWCAFCPMGTMGNALGGTKHQLQLSADCIHCGICKRVCPMGLTPGIHGSDLRDCLHCEECIAACPKEALTR